LLNPITFLRNVQRNVLVLGLSSSFATFGNTLWFFVFPLILEREGANVGDVGLVYGLTILCSALSQIPAGAFADRFGRKKAIVIGSATPIITVSVIAFTSSYVLSSAAYICSIGIGGAFFSIGQSALITESVPKEKLATSFGTFTTMAGWLSVFAPAIGGFYLDRSLQAILLVSILLYACVATVRALFLKETLHALPGSTSLAQGTDETLSAEKEQASKFENLYSNLRTAISNRMLLALTLAYAVYGVLFAQYSFVVTLYSSNVIHLNSFQLGLMFSIFLLVDSQLRIPFGMMADRWDKEKIIVVSWLGEMTLMMIFVFSIGPLFALVSFAIWTAFGALDSPAISALLGIITKKESRGFSYGFFNTFSLLLSIPAPILAGILYSIRPSLPFFTLLVIDFVALLFFLRFINAKTLTDA
jgi:DHA1 family multidrug resistance protein-like MFS transporter